MQRKLRCIAIDDNRNDLKEIELLIKQHPSLVMLRTYIDPVKALAGIQKEYDLDIIFMDIEMPEIDGISLAGLIRKRTRHLVFTTAFQEYAFTSFSAMPSGYLLKPISKLNFADCIFKITEGWTNPAPPKNQSDENLFLPTGNGKSERICIKDIIMFEPNTGTNYTKVYTENKEFEVLSTLIAIENMLRDDIRFMRISRSCLINLNHITELSPGKVLMGAIKKKMSIGPDYLNGFNDYLAERMFGKSV